MAGVVLTGAWCYHCCCLCRWDMTCKCCYYMCKYNNCHQAVAFAQGSIRLPHPTRCETIFCCQCEKNYCCCRCKGEGCCLCCCCQCKEQEPRVAQPRDALQVMQEVELETAAMECPSGMEKNLRIHDRSDGPPGSKVEEENASFGKTSEPASVASCQK